MGGLRTIALEVWVHPAFSMAAPGLRCSLVTGAVGIWLPALEPKGPLQTIFKVLECWSLMPQHVHCAHSKSPCPGWGPWEQEGEKGVAPKTCPPVLWQGCHGHQGLMSGCFALISFCYYAKIIARMAEKFA